MKNYITISKFQIENNKKIIELENLPLSEYENTKCLSKVTNIQKTNIVDWGPNITEIYCL